MISVDTPEQLKPIAQEHHQGEQTPQRRKEQELLFLAEAGAVLASSLELEVLLHKLVGLVVPFLADCCVVALLNNDAQVHRLKVAHADPTMAEAARTLERSPVEQSKPHLASSTIEAKKPTLISEISDDYIKSVAQSEEQLKALLELAPTSQMGLPLIAHGHLLGVLLLSSSSRRYTPEELKLAEELALRAALALDNARLYQEARSVISAQEQILGAVAHELRNPLNAIGMVASMLLQKPTDEGSQRRAKFIEQSVQQADRLVQDLLDVAHLQSGKLNLHKTQMSPKEILLEAAQMVAPEAADGSLHLEVYAEISSTLYADRRRLLRVLFILLKNALKFTPPEGKIILKAVEQREGVCFCVQDTAPNIPQENLPHIFDKLRQAKEKNRRGAGLGLSLAKSIVEAHNGRIWAESTPEHGNQFYFVIP